MNIQFAKSKAGHDKNQLYFILKEEEEFVYLVNGTTRPLEKPKKKRSGMFMEALEAKQQAGKQYNLCVSYNLTYAFLFKFVILSIDCIIFLR